MTCSMFFERCRIRCLCLLGRKFARSPMARCMSGRRRYLTLQSPGECMSLHCGLSRENRLLRFLFSITLMLSLSNRRLSLQLCNSTVAILQRFLVYPFLQRNQQAMFSLYLPRTAKLRNGGSILAQELITKSHPSRSQRTAGQKRALFLLFQIVNIRGLPC
jgi:hypothetical protein